MEIVDLHDRFQPAYFYCLEEWSEEMKESGDLKRRWFEEMKGKGLRVKLAIEDDMALGMIQYLPVEHSIISGKNLYFINCIWVHGHKSGVGNQQKRGIG